jgi:catechol 2,3-dioxygenase-like lactoylglutathione lyase family enzyme
VRVAVLDGDLREQTWRGPAVSCHIAAFALVTRDADRLAAFYTDGIGFSRGGFFALHLGAQTVRLIVTDAPPRLLADWGSGADLWFQHLAIVTTDIAAAVSRASAAGAIPISAGGPRRLPARSGGVTAWKFRDPEGHPLELLQFPDDSVPDDWRGRRGLTLGIDHSAISVSDIDASVSFYRDRYGLSVASRQLNFGPEQARLDGIFGARVDVVALRPPGAATPHLELLRYHPPGCATDVAPSDVAATRIFLADDGFLSPGEDRDPDGHLVVVERSSERV